MPREARPFAAFAQALQAHNLKLRDHGSDPLRDDEFLCARLYTGPTYVKYTTALRGSHASSHAHFVRQVIELNKSNLYTTTIHAINSAVVKLSKLTVARAVYRGVANTTLASDMWLCNSHRVRGGVELAFQSATESREVAFNYARHRGAGKAAMVYEVAQGLINRGASLQWLSQYPHEKEVLFPPLSSVEILGTRVEGTVLVLRVQLCINLTNQTIEQTIARMQHSHVQIIEGMLQDFREAPPRALEPLLALRHEAERRDAAWFNESDNFIQATSAVLRGRREAFSRLGLRETWDDVCDADGLVPEPRLRAMADKCARDGEHDAAIWVLRLLVQQRAPPIGAPTPLAVGRNPSTSSRLLAAAHSSDSLAAASGDVARLPWYEARMVLRELLGEEGPWTGALVSLFRWVDETSALTATICRELTSYRAACPHAFASTTPSGTYRDGTLAPGTPVVAYYQPSRRWIRATFVSMSSSDAAVTAPTAAAAGGGDSGRGPRGGRGGGPSSRRRRMSSSCTATSGGRCTTSESSTRGRSGRCCARRRAPARRRSCPSSSRWEWILSWRAMSTRRPPSTSPPPAATRPSAVCSSRRRR